VDFIEDTIKIEIIAGADRKTQFLRDLKEGLKLRLRQVDVLITTQDIHKI